MSRNFSCFVTTVTAFALLFLCSPFLHAQQAPEGRRWVIRYPKFVKLTSAGIHILPADAKLGSNSIETAIHLPAGMPWKVAFDIKMGPTLTDAMSVHLLQGKTDVAWLGADAFYKSLSAFVGTGNANMPFSQTWDAKWHTFEYVSDGKTLSLWHNGVKSGEGALIGTPDALEVVDSSLELHIRSIHIGKTASIPLMSTKTQAQPPVVADAAKPNDAVNSAEADTSKATLEETKQWICDTINKSAGTLWSDGTDEIKYSGAYSDGNNLIYSLDINLFTMVSHQDENIPLDKMDADSVVVSELAASSDKDTTSYKVYVSSSGNLPVISNSLRVSIDSPTAHELVADFKVYFGDQKTADRFAKAIRHAIRLSRDNPIKEPF